MDELPDALGVGAGRTPDIEAVAHHHHVATLERARSLDVGNAIVREELPQRGLHGGRLAVARGGAGVVDDGPTAGHHGGVLHEARVGELLEGRQHGDLEAAGAQSGDVGIVLLQSLLIDGFAQLGG